MSNAIGMEEGYGYPIVIVKDVNNKNIANNHIINNIDTNGKHGFNELDLALSVTSFEYEYVDDDDDEISIKFETQDQTLADHPSLQEGQMLVVTWGYVNGQKATRVFIIRESKCKYSENKIALEIEGADGTSSLNHLRTQKLKIDQTKENLGNWTTFVQYLKASLGNSDMGFKVLYEGATILDNKTLSSTESNTPVDIVVTQKVGDEKIPIYKLINQATVNEANRTVKQNISEVMSKVDGGPWHVDGTDTTLVIHNRTNSFQAEPTRYYVFRSDKGDVISFTPEVRDKIEKVAAVRGNSINEDNKKANTSEVTRKHAEDGAWVPDADLIAGISEEGSPNFIEAQRALAQGGKAFGKFANRIWLENAKKRYDKWGAIATTVLDYPAFVIKVRQVQAGYIEEQHDLNGNIIGIKAIPARDQTGLPAQNLNIEIRGSVSMYRTSPHTQENLQQMIINEVRGREQKSRTSTIKFIGNPDLKGRDLIHISGVAAKHSGKHYIMKCKHIISSAGYFTIVKTYQESPGVVEMLALLTEEILKPEQIRDKNGDLKESQIGTSITAEERELDEGRRYLTESIEEEGILKKLYYKYGKDEDNDKAFRMRLLVYERSRNNKHVEQTTIPEILDDPDALSKIWPGLRNKSAVVDTTQLPASQDWIKESGKLKEFIQSNQKIIPNSTVN